MKVIYKGEEIELDEEYDKYYDLCYPIENNVDDTIEIEELSDLEEKYD